ncbi:TPA: hypothetical protein DIV45_01320 [Patescibacteria group bacterium]|nr:hypothetical protein [Patescibacteria group bacterium]
MTRAGLYGTEHQQLMSSEFQKLENQLKTLGHKDDFTNEKKQTIRDRVFCAIGQIELADAITAGEEKSQLAVSLKHLQQALIPHRLAFSMPATIMTIMVVFLGSLVTGAAAQGAKPGDTLFAMKKVIESIEIAVVTNPVKKAEKTLNIAGERLQYLGSSLGTEAALNAVLQETQTALVSAKASITKAQEKGDETEIALLLDKFDSLLADQKTLLNDIEQETEDEAVKKTIIAIRDVITSNQDDNQNKKDNGSAGTISSTVAVINPNTPKTTVKPIVEENRPPELDITLNGYQSLTGRIGTANGQIVIFVGNKYYFVTNSPISLQLYIGNSNVGITGNVSNGEIAVYQIYADGGLIGETLPPTLSMDNPAGLLDQGQ